MIPLVGCINSVLHSLQAHGGGQLLQHLCQTAANDVKILVEEIQNDSKCQNDHLLYNGSITVFASRLIFADGGKISNLVTTMAIYFEAPHSSSLYLIPQQQQQQQQQQQH
jgi:hypothetical protein